MAATRPVRILADDLTGAADTAAPFASKNSPVTVLFRPASLWSDPSADVVSVDAGTRAANERFAKETIAHLVDSLPDDMRLLRKIDSLLRGNIAAELAAVRAARPDSVFIVAPAFPQLGRTTRGGIQHLLGAPVGDVAGRLGTKAIVLRADEVRSELDRLVRQGATGPDTIVCDAENDGELDAIVRGAECAESPIVWVGSGGLAAAHARLRHECRGTTAADPAGVIRTREDFGQVLVVVGSASDNARRQALAVVRAFGAEHFELSSTAPAEHSSLGSAKVVVVTVSAKPRGELSSRIETGLANTVSRAVRGARALILTGGSTARAVLCRIGVGELSALAELEPGVVLSSAERTRPWIVTKAGMFGDDEALVRAVRVVGGVGPDG